MSEKNSPEGANRDGLYSQMAVFDTLPAELRRFLNDQSIDFDARDVSMFYTAVKDWMPMPQIVRALQQRADQVLNG